MNRKLLKAFLNEGVGIRVTWKCQQLCGSVIGGPRERLCKHKCKIHYLKIAKAKALKSRNGTAASKIQQKIDKFEHEIKLLS